MLSGFVKTTLPNYLSGLPVPDTFGGWFKLSFREYLSLIPPTAVVVGIGYVTYRAFCNSTSTKCQAGIVNGKIRKNQEKVVDMVDVEDIAEQAAFCRCWKTKNWPYCDGSHGAHNQATDDNVGPLVVKRKNK